MKWASRLWALALIFVLICCSSGGSAPRTQTGGDAGDAGNGGAAGSSGRAPTADPGPAQKVDVGEQVTLDGSASTDPNGAALTFAWTVVGEPVGAKVSFSNPAAVRPKFKVPKTGSYVFELVVSNDDLSSAPARVSISTTDNRPPIARAGEDIAAKVGDDVKLDGSDSSDPDGDKITYAWRFKSRPKGSDAELSDTSALTPGFTLDVKGDYVLELVVNDGALDSDPAEVIVSTGNLAPRAVIAVKTKPVLVDGTVSLDGTGSHDANGDDLKYSWSITSQPDSSTAVLKNADRSKATFVPDLRGDYVVQLIVNDGTVDSKPITALITPDNRKPIANAGLDASGSVGAALTLDGSASSDPDHDTLHYTWTLETFPAGSAAKLSSPTTASPSLAPDVVGEYVAALTVNDGDETSDADRVTVTAALGGAAPVIAGFSPASGPAGTLVTVTGSGFTSPDGAVHVFVTTPSGVIEATVVSATDSELKFILPPGAISGSFTIQIGAQKTQSPTPLTIDPSAKFELALEPSTVTLNPGVSVSAIVRLATTTSFADLAELTIEGLPAGVTATFTPQKIRAGDWSLLTLHAASDQAANQLALTVRASAEIDDASHSELGALAVNVAQVTTAFVGRTVLDDPRETPLTGVTVTLLGKDGNAGSTNCQGTTLSDAAGNFAFVNLPAGCAGTQLVRFNGLTVTNPAGKYSGVDLANNIPPGVATQAPALIHLPRVDTAPTVGVKQNAATDQILTFPGIPNMDVTIYAGTTLTNPDGSKPDPFPLTAIPVPVDRLPEEVPHTQAGFHFFIVAFQPAGGIASQPIAVSYPNLLAYQPATPMNLLTLDPDKGVMVQYGTSKVSDDGLKIVPDADPNHPGHKYGIVHLDWHLPFVNKAPAVKKASHGHGTGCPPESHNSVDFATGIESRATTDISIDGARGGIGIVRMYRTFNSNVGPFGIGTAHNYHHQLSVTALTAATFDYIPPSGNVITFVKQPDGTYINQTDPSVVGAVFSAVVGGSQLRMADGTVLGFQAFTRMGGSMLTSISDPNGNTVTIARNAFTPFDVTTVTDPVGRQLTLSYDASGRVTGITDPLGRTVSYTYGTDGNLSSFSNVLGNVTKYTYTATGQLATLTDPRNVKVIELTYDANGRASSETVVGSGKTTFEYTLINATVPLSPVVETKVTDPLGTVSDYRFNPQGFLLSATDPLGQTNTLNRDGSTNRIVETLGSGACGSCVGGNGHSLFEYNSIGQVLKQTDEAGAVTQTQYAGPFSRPSGVTDPLGNVTKLTYDAHANLTQVTDPLQHSSSFEYDAHGQVTATIDVAGKRSTLTRDGAGNITAIADPAGNISRIRYDAVSRPVETIDALGRHTVTQYDNANHVVQTIDASGAATKFAYDDLGNLTSVTDARGAVTQYTYDTAGRLVTRTDPMQGAEQFAYDDIGRLSQHIDRRGLAATFAYDTLHRLTSATYADSTVGYSYDAQGNVASVTDSAAGEYRFAYDVRNLLTSSQGPSGSLGYTRDSLGRVTAESILGQPDALYTYNAAGQYTRIETQGAGVSYAYDASGRLSTETRDNGLITHYTYDALSAVSGVRHELGGSDIDLQTYEHDATGATTYSEDNLLGAVATSATTASYDLGNRIQTWGGKTFTHDKEGNRLSVSEGSGTESYAWDARGRLKTITQPDGTVVKLGYDFASNLARISTPAGDETQLTDASGNVVLRRAFGGTVQRMLSGLSMDHQIALVDSAQGVRYPLVMQPNSTIATVDAKGLVDGQYSYEPYGATNVTHVPKADYPFLFTGRTRVTDGLYYYRARFYDPGTSRFVSEDPLEFGGGGPNLYEYVEGKPAFSVDPNGQDSLPVQWNLILGTNGIEDAYAWQAQMQQEAYQRERDRKLYSAVQKVVDKEVATAKAHPLGVACEVFASLPCKLIARVPIHPALRVGAFAICEVATTLGCAPLFKEHDQPAGPKAPASCPDGSSPFDRKSAPQSFPSSQSTGVE